MESVKDDVIEVPDASLTVSPVDPVLFPDRFQIWLTAKDVGINGPCCVHEPAGYRPAWFNRDDLLLLKAAIDTALEADDRARGLGDATPKVQW